MHMHAHAHAHIRVGLACYLFLVSENASGDLSICIPFGMSVWATVCASTRMCVQGELFTSFLLPDGVMLIRKDSMIKACTLTHVHMCT